MHEMLRCDVDTPGRSLSNPLRLTQSRRSAKTRPRPGFATVVNGSFGVRQRSLSHRDRMSPKSRQGQGSLAARANYRVMPLCMLCRPTMPCFAAQLAELAHIDTAEPYKKGV